MGHNFKKVLSRRAIKSQKFAFDMAKLQNDYVSYLRQKHFELTSIAEDLSNLSDLSDFKDATLRMVKISHELAGNAQNFGFESVSRTASVLETYLLDNEKAPDHKELMVILKNCLAETSKSLVKPYS